MKQLKKAMFVLCLFCGILFLNPQTAQAKQLKASKSYSIDLDGDGKKETVKYVGRETGEYGYAVSIYINGKKAASLSDEGAVYGSVSAVNIKKSDNYTELYVHLVSDSDCFEKGRGYRYRNGALKKLFTFSREDAGSVRLSIMEKQPGNGLVYFASEFSDSYTMQGYVADAYKISSGKLKPAKKSVMNTTNDWRKRKYKATVSLKAYRSIGAKSAAFTLSKGDVFYIYKIKFKKPGVNYDIAYLYIKTTDGKKGWIKNPQKKYCLGTWSGEEWSDNAYTWG